MPTMNAPATIDSESNSHFSCCRSSPWDPRYRIAIDAIAARTRADEHEHHDVPCGPDPRRPVDPDRVGIPG